MSEVARPPNVAAGRVPALPTRAESSRAVSSRSASDRESNDSEDHLRPAGELRAPPRRRSRSPSAQQGAAPSGRRSDRRRGAAPRRRVLGRGVPRRPRGHADQRLAGPGELPRDAPGSARRGHRDPARGAARAGRHDRRAPARRRRRAAAPPRSRDRGGIAVGSDADGARATSRTRRPRRSRSPATTPTTSTPPAGCGDKPRGRDPAEPAAARIVRIERRAIAGNVLPGVRDRRRLVRLRREPRRARGSAWRTAKGSGTTGGGAGRPSRSVRSAPGGTSRWTCPR